MALGARLLVFGGILIAEGLKTPLVATAEARKAILVERLPTVFPLEEKVRFSDHLKTPIFHPPRGQENATLATRRRPHDTDAFCVITSAPSPELLTHVGHALLRSIATGQGDQLVAAADAITRLDKLLPTASSEARMIAVLMAVTDNTTSQPVVASPAPQSQSQPTPARRKAGKPARPTRKPKASAPLIDVNGRIHPSREIGGVAVISQAEARKALGMSCLQMLKLENQKLLTRIQESGSRLVYYDVCQVQKLLNLIDRGADPEPDADDDVTDAMA